ncbi:DegT/DnrJ/EryC1/StrS aminotransferase family protein [Rhizobium sp. RU36D]|uniref:DegT/DnrJ/EryC1/StrS family aminotransferase n=1 Tax=Rhizobium sp. RU36D TaxID=1907415 RepID=UPI0009D90DD3|nr:DegT/DnrJ/EryC1/StrS aminotransferase family protein [Rhizobium sp. RU36D]SMD15939.1 dTDP-4-amino-4,6-dideoxygalactose transaminase [Rhizobium sp. RU36D]
MIGSLPRLRIYTTLGQYVDVLASLVVGDRRSGDDVAKLEKEIAKRVGTAAAVAMPLARVGLYHAVKALIRPGQKVIMSPYTIADVVNMVVCAGGQPVFADIERETCNIDAAEVERLLTADTGAVLVTHFYGLACDIERIAAACREKGVPLIEDAAQAYGVRVNGKPVGTFGDIGVFSFGMFKNVNSFYGGAIVTNRPELADKIRTTINQRPYQSLSMYLSKVANAAVTDIITMPLFYRSFFFWLFRYAFINEVESINNRMKIDVDPKLKTEIPDEYDRRMRPIQARLVLKQLDRVDRDTAARVEHAKFYYENLKDVKGLIMPPMRTDGSHMYWYFPIQYENRHDLVKFAMRHGRDITESYHRNCAALPCFSQWASDCPRAQATADGLIYLPTYPRYKRSEIAKTVAVIKAYFNQ